MSDRQSGDISTRSDRLGGTPVVLVPHRNLMDLGGGTYRPLSSVCWAEMPLPGRGGWWELIVDIDPGSAPLAATIVMARSENQPPTVTPLPPISDHLSTFFSIPSDAVDLSFEFRPQPGVFTINSIEVRRRTSMSAAGAILWSVLMGRWNHPLAVRRRGLIRAAASGGPGRLHRFRQYLWEAYRDRSGHGTTAPATINHQEWISNWEPPGAAAGNPAKPIVTLICPVISTHGQMLRHTIGSLEAQIDGGWRAVFVSLPSECARVSDVIRDDPRICVLECDDPSWGAMVATAIADVATPFVSVIGVGDELHPWAVTGLSETISANPDTRAIVCDEDEIAADGRRRDPWLKTVWDPDRTRCTDAVGRAIFLHPDDLRQAIAIRPALSSTDARAFAALLGADRVLPAYLPIVALHSRRYLEPDPPADPAARSGWGVDIGISSYRVSRLVGHLIAIPDRMSCPPSVSVIIPTRDRVDLLRTTVEGVLNHTRHPAQLIIVDNGSVERSACNFLAEIDHHPAVAVIHSPGPFNFARLNNIGVEAATGEVLVLLNNDIEVIEGSWLGLLASHAVRPGVGAVGAKLLYPDGTIQHSGVWLGLGGIAGHADVGRPRDDLIGNGRLWDLRTMSAVTAACLAVKRSLYIEVGGLDEEFEVAFNDVDFCLRLTELGHRNIWVPDVVLYHHESMSRGADDTPEKIRLIRHEQQIIVRRWGPLLAHDPYHHPSLNLGACDGLAAFPRTALPWSTVGDAAARSWRESIVYP